MQNPNAKTTLTISFLIIFPFQTSSRISDMCCISQTHSLDNFKEIDFVDHKLVSIKTKHLNQSSNFYGVSSGEENKSGYAG